MMKAIQITEYGQVLTKLVERPEPAADEVLVKIVAAGVNPVDWKIASGDLAVLVNQSLPLTLGWDLAGEIIALGSEVSGFNVGESVFGMPEIGRNGTFAEYCVVKASALAVSPKTVGMTEAAAYPLVCLTSWQTLFTAGELKAGQRVLIHAGAGGVGHVAIQLAKAKGAYVISTTSEANRDFVAQLGADEIINYCDVDFEAVLENNKVDLVLDTLGGEAQRKSLNVLNAGGRLVSIAGITPEIESVASTLGVTAEFVFVQGNGEQLRNVAEMVDARQLSVTVAKTFSLDEVTTAFDMSKQGRVRGKLVVQIA
ncbi:NADP-dependent oxidoreductase [Enterovibrio calviensis]|uniref:NADP-dependent oxidoreductase n=1 Tax=Enterovibrio calviensis TaxID=91359 RepID=UPI003735B3D1